MHRLLEVIRTLCEDVGTPRALAVKLLSEAGEWTQLCKLRVRPQDYRCPEQYFKDALVTELLRKAKLETEVDKEGVAVATFWECEAQNKVTNQRLQRYVHDNLFIETHEHEAVYRFIIEWRKDIADLLGRLPDHLTPRFSGGASYADSGSLTTIPDKMSSHATITDGARCLLPLWSETSWARALFQERSYISDPKTVRGNKFLTVPKDAEKHRGICKEPSINVAYQLDVGAILKRKLKDKLGIDLSSGEKRHRRLARAASVSLDLATVDMSNASDTICRTLVRVLLPTNWFQLLDSLRSPRTLIKGKWVLLEKFSSMGNGFTFELETIIFATLARTIARLNNYDASIVSCYGDDLIVESGYVDDLLKALEYFGFTPNEKKSFFDSTPFRESCGGDYFAGVSVRAHYVKDLPDEPQEWICLANGLRRVAGPECGVPNRFRYIHRAWLRALSYVPSNIRRCRGPSELGDIVIHDEPDSWNPKLLPTRRTSICEGVKTFQIRAYAPVHRTIAWKYWMPAVQLASCTLGPSSSGVIPRNSVEGYRMTWVQLPGSNYIPKRYRVL